tara:strand:- start:832 stop:1131 length:300 start_codon:yes stop_codon:yes gene_type:complete
MHNYINEVTFTNDENKETNNIVIKIKSNYGVNHYYPQNRTAKNICEAFGKKTLTPAQIKKLSLSFEIYLGQTETEVLNDNDVLEFHVSKLSKSDIARIF